MKKRCLFGALLLAASLSLSACGYRTVQEMYRFPKRTQEYTALQSTIEQAMSGMGTDGRNTWFLPEKIRKSP